MANRKPNGTGQEMVIINNISFVLVRASQCRRWIPWAGKAGGGGGEEVTCSHTPPPPNDHQFYECLCAHVSSSG